MKNKHLIVIFVIVIGVIICGVSSVRNNYRLGRDIYYSALDMSVQSRGLADSIGYLLEEIENLDENNEGISTHSFEQAIVDVHLHFGHVAVPLTEEVHLEWIKVFDDIFQHRVVNKSSEYIVKIIEEEADKWTELKNQLENMAQCFEEFCEQYDQMSNLERGFTSWESVQKTLSDRIGTSNY